MVPCELGIKGWRSFRDVNPPRSSGFSNGSQTSRTKGATLNSRHRPSAGVSIEVARTGAISCKYAVVDELREIAVRTALFIYLDDLLSRTEDDTLRWDQTGSFQFNGETLSIRQTRGRGINKPTNLDGALSITTAFTPFGKQPPYDDLVGDDGYLRYKYEGIDFNTYTNRSFRICMDFELPLVYFFGVRRAWVQGDLPNLHY